MTDTYFGYPDAAHESPGTILPNHVSRDFEVRIKCGARSEGKQIVVGIKGSGKTALRRYIECTEPALVWNLDCDHTYLDIEVQSLTARSGVLKNSLALELLRSFTHFLLNEGQPLGLSHNAVNRLRRGGEAVLDILKNIPDAVDLKTPIAQVKLSELMKSKSAPLVKAAWKELREQVLPAIGNLRAYIMIDDAGDVFPGLERNPDFIEGLARAVHDINGEYGSHLHVLLFLKHGVYRQWFENQRELDKVEHVVQELSWDHAALCEVLGKRIAGVRNVTVTKRKPIGLEQLWALEFDWKDANFNEFAREITRYCLSGPRDIIKLANMAKWKAGNDKIAWVHVDQVLKEYSENRLSQIGADFGDVYPNIHRFIGHVFQGCPAEMGGRQVAEWIEKNAMTDHRVDEEFKSLPWYSTSSKEKLTKLMYEVGLLGKRTATGESVYSIEAPTKTTSELLDSTLTIHPAFRPHLAVSERTQTTKATKARRSPAK